MLFVIGDYLAGMLTGIATALGVRMIRSSIADVYERRRVAFTRVFRSRISPPVINGSVDIAPMPLQRRSVTRATSSSLDIARVANHQSAAEYMVPTKL